MDANHPDWEALQAHWTLTEGAGLEVSNNTSSQLDGILQGAEWQQPESLIIFDYSNTPRIVDVAVTALDHMCIDLDPAWNLDGISWVNGCNSVDLAGVSRETLKTKVFPNPGTEAFQITGLPPHSTIEVFGPNGQSIHRAQSGSSTHITPHTSSRGVYLIRIVDGKEQRTLRWIRQ